MPDPTQVQGLPPGAVVKPIAGATRSVEGLPPGAVVKPVGGEQPADSIDDLNAENNPSDSVASQVGDVSQGIGEGMGAGIGKVVATAAQAIHDSPHFGEAIVPQQGIEALKQNNEEHSQSVTQKIGEGIEDVATFLLGDGAAMQGLSYAAKLQKIAPVMKSLEEFPRLAKIVTNAVRTYTTGTANAVAHGEDLGDASKEGLITGAAGATAEGAAMTKTGRKIISKIPGLKGLISEPTPYHFDEAEAASKITDAINPSAKDMPKFSSNNTKQVGRVMDYAERSGIDLTDPKNARANYLKATKGAKEETSKLYYEKLLDPVQHKMVGVSEIPGYKGQTLGEGRNVASLKQLDDRLTAINAELYPSYQKGGQAGTVAVIDHGALTAESRGIRKTLYETMGKELGIDSKAIADARQSIGELSQIADRTEFALNSEREAANAQSRKPITLNPWHKDNSKLVGDKTLNAVANKFRDTPDSQLADVFEHLKANKPVVPKPNAPAAKPPQDRTPAWKKGEGPATSSIGDTMAAKEKERLAQVAANNERMAKNRMDREANKATNEANKAKHAAAHGSSYKAAQARLTRQPESATTVGTKNFTEQQLADFKAKNKDFLEK